MSSDDVVVDVDPAAQQPTPNGAGWAVACPSMHTCTRALRELAYRSQGYLILCLSTVIVSLQLRLLQARA